MSTTAAQVSTCFYLLMEITCWLHVVFILIFSIYLFIYSKRRQQKQVEPPPVFIYLWKWLVVRHGFLCNIQYLFVYLFKAMSTKAGGIDHLFLFTYANHLLWDMVFVLIFSIYLFIYSKGCQQKQVEVTTFIYLCKLLVVRHGFRFNIQYLFIYLFKAMSTKAGGSDDLFITACNEVRSRLCFYIHN